MSGQRADDGSVEVVHLIRHGEAKTNCGRAPRCLSNRLAADNWQVCDECRERATEGYVVFTQQSGAGPRRFINAYC